MMICVRKLLQPAAEQVERVQSDEYEFYVFERRILQPTAQQLDGYVWYV